jgi:hypothetical protein
VHTSVQSLIAGSRLEIKIVTDVMHQLKRVRIPSKGARRELFREKKHGEILKMKKSFFQVSEAICTVVMEGGSNTEILVTDNLVCNKLQIIPASSSNNTVSRLLSVQDMPLYLYTIMHSKDA